MAPRIVSWRDKEIYISPVRSSAASMVSFDSTFSDTYPTRSHSQMSLTTSEAPGLPRTEFGTRYSILPAFSEEKIPRVGHATPDDSFIQHDAYFFKDGNVTFLTLGICNHEALPTIISIGDVERKDFEALLSVLYPANFEAHELTYEQWKSVLHLSTRWGFASLRKLALKSIKPPTSHDQFVLARTYSVDHWVLPALTALCERTLPLNLDEARQMSMEDVILVATVREEIRGGELRVDTADIPPHIEVARVGKLNPAPPGPPSPGPPSRAPSPGAPSWAPRSRAPSPGPRSWVHTRAPRSRTPSPVPCSRACSPTPPSRAPSRAPSPSPCSRVPFWAPRSRIPSPTPHSRAPSPAPRSRGRSRAPSCAPSCTPSRACSPAPRSRVPSWAHSPAPRSRTPSPTPRSRAPSRAHSPAPPRSRTPSRAPRARTPSLVPLSLASPTPPSPVLHLDHIREVSTAPTMFASSPGIPADEAPLEYDKVPSTALQKIQKKKMREKARKQAQKGEKNGPRPSSGATSNSVDNSVVQEPKPAATAPVGRESCACR